MQEQSISESVFEAAERLHESLDPGEIVARAMSVLPTLVEAESWAVFLKTDQNERLELVRAINASALPFGPFLEIGGSSSPIARAVSEQRTIIARLGEDEAQLDLKFGEDRLATLCVPLVATGRLLGAIQATRKISEGGPLSIGFTRLEARSVEMVCGAMARSLANAAEYHKANRQTLVDDLTRLYNVRYLYQTLDNEIRRARRYSSAVSVVFMDLDGFKLVNDAYGHRAGSVTLTEVADVILA